MSAVRGHRWLVWLAGIVLTLVTARLGVWQLDRAAQKTALQQQIRQQKASVIVDLSKMVASRDVADSVAWRNELHRPGVALGRWLPQHTVLLDNRQMDGRPGFFVLTPLVLEGATTTSGQPLAMVVQRGWVPRDFLQRERLPQIASPEGLQRFSVRVAPPPARLLELGGGKSQGQNDALAQAGSNQIRQNLDLQAFARSIAQASSATVLVSAATLLQMPEASADSAAQDGLQRRWPEADSGVAKHHGYAFQWFGLSVLTVSLLLWFQVIAPRRAKKNS